MTQVLDNCHSPSTHASVVTLVCMIDYGRLSMEIIQNICQEIDKDNKIIMTL